MTTIPEMCMQYTEVFRTLRMETGIAVIVGVLIGMAAMWLEKRR